MQRYEGQGQWPPSSPSAARKPWRSIEKAATELTDGNKTEAVALAMRRLLEESARAGSLFGTHRGSVRARARVDLTAPALDVKPDAETGREIDR